MLSFVGLDRPQESAYRLLVQAGSVTAADAARQLRLTEPEAAALLRMLEERGLAAPSDAGGAVWSPRGR